MVRRLEMKGPVEPGSIKMHHFQFKVGEIVAVPGEFGWPDVWVVTGYVTGESVEYSVPFYQPTSEDSPRFTDMFVMAAETPLVVPDKYRLARVVSRWGAMDKIGVLTVLVRTAG